MKKYILFLLCSILYSCATPLYKTGLDIVVYRNVHKTDSTVLPKSTFWIQNSTFGKRDKVEEIIVVDTSKVYQRNKSLSIGFWRFVQYDKVYVDGVKTIELKKMSIRATIDNRYVNAVPRSKYVELGLGSRKKEAKTGN
jgi:hypothetical protein